MVDRKSKWLESVETSRKAFTEHIYNNEEFNWFDALQHRALLLRRLSEADSLKLDFLELHGFENMASDFLSDIDRVSKDLLKEFLEWHLPPDFKDPVPASFEQGMKEAEGGNVVEFPGGET